MTLSTKIAWRNVWLHKSKSIIVGIIIFLGTFLMVFGNAIVSGMEKGLEENLRGTFTGDIVVISNKENSDAVFGDISGSARELIPDYFRVEEIIKQNQGVDKVLGMAFGMNFVLNEETDMIPVGVIGADIDEFLNFYGQDFYKIVEGKMLKKGERGVITGNLGRNNIMRMGDFWIQPFGSVINREILPKEAKEFGKNLDIRNELIIMGAGKDSSSFDIKIPVVGIYKLKSLDKLMGDNFIMDIDSFREANGMIVGKNQEMSISDNDKNILMEGFGFSDNFIEENKESETDLNNLFEKSEEIKLVGDSGAYNILVIKAKKNINQNKLLIELNKFFYDGNLGVRAVSWSQSLGFVGKIALFIRIILNVFVFFIFFVAIIVIMNTLSMTAMERVAEIGMMRAIGAQKSFLKIMFIKETGILSFFFGGIGILTSIFVIVLLRYLKLETTNEFLQLAYGGDYLNPVLKISDLAVGLVELILVTILSLIYPIKLVGQIRPLDAILRD